jgi:glycosyltransferase involved in cell wall biosynthesis
MTDRATVDLRQAPNKQTRIPLSDILVIIPAYNESQSIASVLREVRAEVPGAGILVVDDGSLDETALVCVSEKVELLRLPFNLGVGGAMRAGYLYAQRHGWTVVAQIDADGQHDPRFIPAMLDQLAAGTDIVIGARFAGRGEYQVSRPRRISMLAISALMSRICGTRLTDATSGLRIVDRAAIELFASQYPAEYLGDTLQSLVIAKRAGLSVKQIPVEMRIRAFGKPSQDTFASILYLLRCMFALTVQKQSLNERNFLAKRRSEVG